MTATMTEMGNAAEATATNLTDTTPDQPLVFVYGTLMGRDVIENVIGREYTAPMFAASIYGYERVQPRGWPYPFLVEQSIIDPAPDEPRPVARVNGLIATGLTKGELAHFDSYEGIQAGLYTREITVAYLAGTTQAVRVYAYVAGMGILAALGGKLRIEITPELRDTLTAAITPQQNVVDDDGSAWVSEMFVGTEPITPPAVADPDAPHDVDAEIVEWLEAVGADDAPDDRS